MWAITACTPCTLLACSERMHTEAMEHSGYQRQAELLSKLSVHRAGVQIVQRLTKAKRDLRKFGATAQKIRVCPDRVQQSRTVKTTHVCGWKKPGKFGLIGPLAWYWSAVLLAALGWTQSAQAHGIAGNRLFPGTLSFDDPAVSDDFAITASMNGRLFEGLDVTDRSVNLAFARLLTPTLSLGMDAGLTRRTWGRVSQMGAMGTNLTLKGEIYRDDLHETLVSASLVYGIGNSGSQRVGAAAPSTVQSGLYFGRGFGDLPEEMSWLRPFGITGALALEVPTRGASTNLAYQPAGGDFTAVRIRNVETLHWGFAVQYSSLYRTSRFTPGRLPDTEPLHQFVPLIEFAFDSPRGRKTTGTVNPGIAYVADTWQVAAELVVPLNRLSGRGYGARVQVLYFIDDLMPSVFGKPLLGR